MADGDDADDLPPELRRQIDVQRRLREEYLASIEAELDDEAVAAIDEWASRELGDETTEDVPTDDETVDDGPTGEETTDGER